MEECLNYDVTKYPRPSLTADVILFAGQDKIPSEVLLIRRKNPPFKGCWAFPGGFMDMEETLLQCALRELEEETGLRLCPEDLEFLTLADNPGRDPRTRVVSAVYTARKDKAVLNPLAGDDAAEVQCFPLEDLPPLAFDHEKILRLALAAASI